MAFLLRLLRTPLSTVVVATLALAIGANTAVFGVVNAVLLRPPPFSDVDRLVIPYITHTGERGSVSRERWSYPRLQLLRGLAVPELFDDLASFSRATLIRTGDTPEPVDGEVVSPSYFRVLAVRPVLGRVFTEDENMVPGAHPVALIGDDLWRRDFAADTGAIGRRIGVAGTTFTVIGVLPPGFRGLTGHAELWIPAAMAAVVSYDKYLGWRRSVPRSRGGYRARRKEATTNSPPTRSCSTKRGSTLPTADRPCCYSVRWGFSCSSPAPTSRTCLSPA